MERKVTYLIIVLFCLFSLYNVKALGEATLKNIKVNNKDVFCTGYECNVEVDAKIAKVTYELGDPAATVDRLSGFSVDLNGLVTVVKIVVTNNENEEKIENTYNISITLHEKSNDYTLKSLKINDDVILLQEDVYVYSYQAKYYDELLKIDAVTNDLNAKLLSKDEYKFDLDRSSLSIDLDVEAENKETKTYRVVVTRSNRPDTSLKSLKVDHGNINFKSDVLEYDLSVEYNVNDIIVEAIANNEDAVVKIEKEDLVVGDNTIKIIVTVEKASSEYILHVNREPNLDKSLANLAYLKVSEYPKLNFEENVLDYTLFFDEIPSKLTIDAKPKSSDGRVEIFHNEELKDQDKVIVKVTLNETGITREYSLLLSLNTNNTSNKTPIIISIIFLVITTGVISFLEIREKKLDRFVRLNRIKNLKKKKDKEIKNKKNIEKDDDIEII